MDDRENLRADMRATHAGLGSSRHVVTEQLVKRTPESISTPLTAISEKLMITDMTKTLGGG